MSTLLSRGNSKLKKTDKMNGTKTLIFSLPALKTCPRAGECRKFCYATKGTYQWPVVKAKRDRNLKATKNKNFMRLIGQELTILKPTHVRIHDSGDFYSMDYFISWVKIASAFPMIQFYAYTKSVITVKSYGELPSNLKIIFSFGGMDDGLIDVKKDAHSIVIDESQVGLFSKKGYITGNDNDHAMLQGFNKIMLIKH